MKKTISTLVVIMFATAGAFAQLSQGTMAVGGGISFQSDKQEVGDDEVKSNEFSFTPTFSYFLSDRVALGVSLQFSSGTDTDEFDVEQKTNAFAVGPHVRFYIPTKNEKFAFYAEGTVQFVSGKTEVETADFERKFGGLGIGVSPGFTYFLTEHWGLDLQLQGIQYLSIDPDKDADDDKQSSFTYGVDSFNPTLGFKYYF